MSTAELFSNKDGEKRIHLRASSAEKISGNSFNESLTVHHFNSNATPESNENSDGDVIDRIAELLIAIPGGEALAALSSIDPRKLPPAARIDYLTALERQASWVQALIQRAIVAVAGREATESDDPIYGIDEAEREDISTALRISPHSAQIKIDLARTLTNNLPNTCSALATGEISAAHATAIAREAYSAIDKGLPDSVIFEIENRAITFSEFHTPTQVGNLVRNIIAKRSPEDFEEAVADARDDRKVFAMPDINGMSTVIALLPAEGAQIVMNAVEAHILRAQQLQKSSTLEDNSGQGQSHSTSANNVGEENLAYDSDGNVIVDERTKDMQRADALVAIASQYLASTLDDVTPHRRPLTVNVTVDLPTLLGLAENPGQLAGYGAIPASVAREIAADARWKRFITEPLTGNLLDYGREHYEPPQALKDFLIARDRICRFPGCRRSAILSDLDHAQAFDDGGGTSPANLGALCRRHHRMKTHGGWKVESFEDGSCTWTSPFGKTFHTPARSQDDPI